MTVIVDAAPIIAAASPNDRLCARIRDVMRSEVRLVVPAPVTAEIDYLLRHRVGVGAAHSFLDDVSAGLIEVVGLTAPEHATARRLDGQYKDLGIGLAGASVIVLAHRLRTTRVLTLDQRHFRAVRSLDGNPFTILPFDTT